MTVRTYSPKPADIQRQWHVIDATDVVLGRLAVQTATLLRGKHKPTFAPHVDGGDFVIIVNADKVALSGDKKVTKMAYRHSGYPGGLSATPFGELLEKDPRRAIEKAETKMLDSHLHHCVVEGIERGDPTVLDELVQLYDLKNR